MRRLRVERARYENALADAELEVDRTRRALTLLVLPEQPGTAVTPAESLAQAVRGELLETALTRAEGRRPELRVARADVESAHAALRAARSEGLPDPTLTAGVKRQSPDTRGLFLGVSVPLPTFDRNRPQIRAQEARLQAAETRLALVERQVEQDVRLAFERYASYRDRIESIQRALLSEADALLDIARISYEEGEMTLLELLDAADAYRDARISDVALRRGLWTSFVELARASAGGFAIVDP